MLGVGGGATFYCIITRCDEGTLRRVVAAYAPTPRILVEGGLRWHDCFDCDRFLIGDVGVQLRRASGRARPYLGAGLGFASDPDFMGEHLDLYASTGTWIGVADALRLQVELRGQRVGSEGVLIALTAALALAFP